MAENASELQVDLKKGFIVGGDSAGANLSAAIALKARDDPFFTSRPLTGQYLREHAATYPGTYPEKYKDSFRSLDEFADTPLLNKEKTIAYFGACIPDFRGMRLVLTYLTLVATYCPSPSDLRMSPVLASSHAGLPPAFFQVQELDPVRDDGLVYEKMLRDEGVLTNMIRYVFTVDCQQDLGLT